MSPLAWAAAASAFLVREGYDVRYVNGAFGAYAEAHAVETGTVVSAAA